MPRLSNIPIKVLAILICTQGVRASNLGIKASSPEVFCRGLCLSGVIYLHELSRCERYFHLTNILLIKSCINNIKNTYNTCFDVLLKVFFRSSI